MLPLPASGQGEIQDNHENTIEGKRETDEEDQELLPMLPLMKQPAFYLKECSVSKI